MRKALRWFSATVGGLMLALIALYGFARMRGLDEEQKAALALLERSPPPPGRNAFALLWLLPYDMPEAERERVLAEDLRHYAQRSPTDANQASFSSSAEARYAVAPDTSDHERYCKWRDRDCLAKVRAEPDTYAALLKADAALVARADTLADYGHTRNPFPPRLDMPLPAYRPLAYPMTRHALAFASGDMEAGLDGVCRGVSGARMLIRSGDNLINSMVGVAMLEGNAGLLAEMLAELPADHPLPASCTAAFVPPVADEFNLCGAMRAEAGFAFSTLRQIDEAEHPLLLSVLYDPDKTIARAARPLAWYCGAPNRAALAADMPAPAPPSPPSRWQRPLECVDNVLGCVLADASPAYIDYQRRLQDADIRLKATATLLWLRDRPDAQSLADRLASRPATLRSPRRELRLGGDGTLSVALYFTRDGKRWALPLPASRRGPAVRTSL